MGRGEGKIFSETSLLLGRNSPNASSPQQAPVVEPVSPSPLELARAAATDGPSEEFVRGQIDEGQAEILRIAAQAPAGQWWDPRELRDRAQGQRRGDVMMSAMIGLINDGDLETDSRLRVRLSRKAQVVFYDTP